MTLQIQITLLYLRMILLRASKLYVKCLLKFDSGGTWVLGSFVRVMRLKKYEIFTKKKQVLKMIFRI